MPVKPRLTLHGEKELIAKLTRLSKPRRLKTIIRKATNAAATPIVKGVRREWPVDTGLSKKSVQKKIVSGKAGYTAIIGIDRKAEGTSHGRRHVPSNIDHLVEFGYQTKSGRTVPARAPLRRGYDASAKQAEAKFAEKAAADLEKEVAKR